MIKIDKLPNYFNGKLYKRWENVRDLYETGSILASKTAKDGTVIQLLLSENGKRKELFSNNGKIMDILDKKGIKRIYLYQRADSNTVKGQMIAQTDATERFPLIISAKWILKNLMPDKLFIKINTKHPLSQIFIPEKSPDGTSVYTGKINKLHVAEIFAKDFENYENPIPKTIILKTTKGTTKPLLSDSTDETIKIAQHFGIESEILGQNLRTIV